MCCRIISELVVSRRTAYKRGSVALPIRRTHSVPTARDRSARRPALAGSAARLAHRAAPQTSGRHPMCPLPLWQSHSLIITTIENVHQKRKSDSKGRTTRICRRFYVLLMTDMKFHTSSHLSHVCRPPAHERSRDRWAGSRYTTHYGWRVRLG